MSRKRGSTSGRAAWLIGLAILAAGAAPGRAEASCAAQLKWDDMVYIGNAIHRTLDLGDELGTATVPGCNDSIPASPAPDRQVSVREVAGTDPKYAVGRAGEPSTLYLANGYLISLLEHPLHGLLYASDDRPNEMGPGCSPGELFTFLGTLEPGQTLIALRLRAPLVPAARRAYIDGAALVFVDVNTELVRAGNELPRLAEGDRLRVRARECRASADRTGIYKLVAERIELLDAGAGSATKTSRNETVLAAGGAVLLIGVAGFAVRRRKPWP